MTSQVLNHNSDRASLEVLVSGPEKSDIRDDGDLSKRRILQQSRDDLLSMSPIQKLSSEVLLEIFTEVCKDPAIIDGFPVMPADILSRTCSFWRMLALSHSRIWASFDLCVGISSCYPHWLAVTRGFLHLYLSRSRNAPLTVGIIDDYSTAHYRMDWPTPQADVEIMQDMFRMLADESHRWYRIRITIEPPLMKYVSSLLPQSGFPTLQSLDIKHHYTCKLEDCTMLAKCLRVFKNSPKLQAVTLPYRPTLYQLPYGQLTSLVLSECVFPDDLSVLNHCTSLESLTIKNYECRRNMSVDVNLSLTFLTNLDLGWHSTDLRPLFGAFRLPSLISLHFPSINDRGPHSWDGTDYGTFFAMLSWCSESLQTLSLRTVYDDGLCNTMHRFKNILATLPRLESLFVDVRQGEEYSYNGYAWMSVLACDTLLVPRLTRFELAVHIDDSTRFSAVRKHTADSILKHTVGLVERRCLSSPDVLDGRMSCLREFKLRWCLPKGTVPVSSRYDLVAVENLSRDGVCISVECPVFKDK